MLSTRWDGSAARGALQKSISGMPESHLTITGRMRSWLTRAFGNTFLGPMFLLLVGHRETGSLGLTDLLVVLVAVDAASIGLSGESESIGDSFVLVLIVFAWSVVLDAIAYRWPRFGRVLKARPRLLIDNGQLDRRAMRRELMNEDEVYSQLRLHGIEDVSLVHRAYIEPNGMVSVVLITPPDTAEQA